MNLINFYLVSTQVIRQVPKSAVQLLLTGKMQKRGSSSRSFSYGHMDTQLLAGQAQSDLNCHLRIETIWQIIISHLVNGVCTTFKCLGLLAWVSFSHHNSLCALLSKVTKCFESQQSQLHSPDPESCKVVEFQEYLVFETFAHMQDKRSSHTQIL